MRVATDHYYRPVSESQVPASLSSEVIKMASGPITNSEPSTGVLRVKKPGIRQYNRRGGCPPLDVDFKAVCDAVLRCLPGRVVGWCLASQSVPDRSATRLNTLLR